MVIAQKKECYKVKLITDYGFVYMYDPEQIWVRQSRMKNKYLLLYRDAEWEHRTIYTSSDKYNLEKLRDTIIDGLAQDKTTIDVR